MNEPVKQLPPDFSEQQLDALRVLLTLARGQVPGWASLFPGGGAVSKRDLNAFLGEQSRLDFGQNGARPKISEIYKVVYYQIEKDPYGIRSHIRTLVSSVYRDDQAHGWERAFEDGYGATNEEYSKLARRISGNYLTFRRGTSLHYTGEVVTSPMKISSRVVAGRTQIHFEIAYPLRSALGLGHIDGRIASLSHHLHFVGYDRSSLSAYLQCAFRNPGSEKINEFNGIALRVTTQSTTFAARVHGRRLSTSWEEALGYADMQSPENFILREGPKADTILRYIDNAIDNTTDYVLRQYER